MLALTVSLGVGTAATGIASADDELTLRLVRAAREQVGVTVIYDGSYRALAYPGGDVPIERGVCTDVVVRAYRALGFDLQRAVHEDMTRAWPEYPKLWGLERPDRNIDHRRVPNLAAYLRRRGAELRLTDDPAAFRPGDLVTWRLPSGVPHIGIVSDRRIGERPLILHNIGAGAREEDVLFTFERTAHFRFVPTSPTGP
jgi:uncharacterized protein YijF (DUF1287 family)